MKKVNMKVAIDIKKGRSSTKIVGGEWQDIEKISPPRLADGENFIFKYVQDFSFLSKKKKKKTANLFLFTRVFFNKNSENVSVYNENIWTLYKLLY